MQKKASAELLSRRKYAAKITTRPHNRRAIDLCRSLYRYVGIS